MTQLSLLPSFELDVVLQSANKLIDMLNDGMPKKELYYAQGYFLCKGYYVFIAANKARQPLFNILDSEGKALVSPMWRVLQYIEQELDIKFKTIEPVMKQ